jgi:hypothetical protein
LREWINVNRWLGRRWQLNGDAPWWYNERALVSTFAGAVWLSGGYAFEEYSETKRGKSKRGFTGRVDLEFSVGPHEFKAEAKQCWPAGTAKRDQTDYITGFMDQARQDVRRCPPGGMRRLAIVFGVPYLARRLRSEMPERISWLVDQAMQVEADAVAWTFPDLRRVPTIGGWTYPGIIVWIKEVRR